MNICILASKRNHTVDPKVQLDFAQSIQIQWNEANHRNQFEKYYLPLFLTKCVRKRKIEIVFKSLIDHTSS